MLLWCTWQSNVSYLGLQFESVTALKLSYWQGCLWPQERWMLVVSLGLQFMERCVFPPQFTSLHSHVQRCSSWVTPCQFTSVGCHTFTVVISSRFQCLVTSLYLVLTCAVKVNMGCFPRCLSRPHTSSIVIVGMKGTYSWRIFFGLFKCYTRSGTGISTHTRCLR